MQSFDLVDVYGVCDAQYWKQKVEVDPKVRQKQHASRYVNSRQYILVRALWVIQVEPASLWDNELCLGQGNARAGQAQGNYRKVMYFWVFSSD